MRLQPRACVPLFLVAAMSLTACVDREARDLARAKALAAKSDLGAARIGLKNAVQAHPKSGEARFLLGQHLLVDGEATTALVELERARDFKYDDSLVLPRVAEALNLTGQSKQVIDRFADTPLPDPNGMARLQAALAYAYIVRGDPARAGAAIDRALALAPKSAPALMMKARLAAINNDLAAANAAADQLLAAHPQDDEAWSLKGDLLRRSPEGRAAAIEAYGKALQFKPGQLHAHSSLVGLYLTAGDLDAARKQLAALKKVAPEHPNTAMFEAHLAAALGNLPRAREIFQSLLRALPTNVNLLLSAGEVELKLNAPIQAEAHFAKALALAPENTLARRMLAQAQVKLGQAAKAQLTLAPLIDTPTARPDDLALAAMARLMNGDAKGADALYVRLAKLKPTDPKLRTVVAVTGFGRNSEEAVFQELRTISTEDAGTTADMAIVSAHLRRKQYAEALAALVDLERKRPKDAQVQHLRGQVLAMNKDDAGARKSFEQALAIDVNYFPAISALAALDLQDKQPEAARNRFTDLLKRQPSNGRAMLALAELSVLAGQPRAEVIKQLEAAAKAAPTDPDVRSALIQQYFDGNQFDAALTAALAATASIPNNIELLEMLGRCQLRVRLYNQALTTYGNVASLAPKSPRGFVGMADVHIASGDWDQAQRRIAKALELSPDLPEALAQSVLVALRKRQPNEALVAARRLQKVQPTRADGWLLEGEIETGRGNWDAAATAYRKALEKPAPGAAAIKLHQALLRGGKPAEAEAVTTLWLKAHPQDTGYLFYLATVASTAGDAVTAERYYRQVLALQAEHALALNNLAMLYVEQKKSGAVDLAQRAIKAAPDRPVLLDTLAQAQAAENNPGKAVETQQRAVALAPDEPNLRLSLARYHLQVGNKALAKGELDKLAAMGSKFPQQAEVARLQSGLTTFVPGR